LWQRGKIFTVLFSVVFSSVCVFDDFGDLLGDFSLSVAHVNGYEALREILDFIL